MAVIVEIGIWIILAVVITTAIYHIAPFRKKGSEKPGFVWLPKYAHNFSIPVEDVIERIEELGFSSKLNSNCIFERGKVYGDFSAKAMKLRIVIEKENKIVKVFAPYMGVFFDNGDLWSITDEITIENRP